MDMMDTAKSLLDGHDERVVDVVTAVTGGRAVVALTGVFSDGRLRFRRWDAENSVTFGGAWLTRASDLTSMVAL